MRINHRMRWQFPLVAAVALLCLLWALAGSASASHTVDVEGRSAITLDSDVHWWQQSSQDHSKVVSYGGYQYVAYWDAADARLNVYLKISRRRLSDNNVQSITLNLPAGRLADPLDPFDTAVLGVSPADGRLHVEWVEHSSTMHYAMSAAGCLSQATFSSCTFEWRHQTTNLTQEEQVSYPIFVNDRAGNLYCGFRHGTSLEAVWVLHSYGNNSLWTDLGTILNGNSGSGSYVLYEGLGWEPSTFRSPYVDAVAFDHNNRMHLMWTWAEHASISPFNQFLRQHDVYYAYSDDSGLTWNDNEGTRIGTHQSDPIVVGDTSSKVVTIALGDYRVNNGRMVIDRDNQPHMIIPTSDFNTIFDTLKRHLRATHIWRTTDGTWNKQFIEPTESGQGAISIGDLQFNRANDAYYVYPLNTNGWQPVNLALNVELPADHVTNQEGANLVVEPMSTPAIIETNEYIGTTIATGSATDNRDIVIRIKNTTDATDARFGFMTEADRWFEPVAFTDPNDGAFHTITVPMTSQGRKWSGTLRALQLVGAETATAGSGKFTIDYIRIENDWGRSRSNGSSPTASS